MWFNTCLSPADQHRTQLQELHLTALKGTLVKIKLDYNEPEPQKNEKDGITDHREAEYKRKMKQQREGRQTRENNLLLGDYVLVKQPRKNKWSTPYELVFYVVCSLCRDASQFVEMPVNLS